MLSLILVLQTSPATADPELGPIAFVFMLASMGSVAGLTAWCFYRVLTTRRHFDPDGTGPARAPVPGKLEQEGREP